MKYGIVVVVVLCLSASPVSTTTSATPSANDDPIAWPEGTYGLMEAATGCPGSYASWHVGYRKYDTENNGPHNYFSGDIQQYLSGTFALNDLETNFCMKTQVDNGTAWPSGTYCLLKYNLCPPGFKSGYIYWDDADSNNHDAAGGTLPDGTYDKNTKIFYCCRKDGSTKTAIHLPRDRQFVLMRYSTTCQAVYGMNLHEVYVRWDDVDDANEDSSCGAHPYDDGGLNDHRLHFCHYSSNQTAPVVVG